MGKAVYRYQKLVKHSALAAVLCAGMLNVALATDLSPEQSPERERTQALEILAEIEKYKISAPLKSYTLIQEKNYLYDALPLDKQMEWLFATLVAANRQSDQVLLRQTLRNINELKTYVPFESYIPRALIYLGHHGVQSASFRVAKRAYLCALSHAPTQDQKFASLYSLGLTYLSEGSYQKAKPIYNKLYEVVQGKDMVRWEAASHNALGVIAMETADYSSASTHFRAAMDAHQAQADRGSELIAALNLLTAFMFEGDFESYDRLAERTERMAQVHDNHDLRMYLEWVQAAARVQRGQALEDAERKSLRASFDSVDNNLIKQPMRDHLAPIIGVRVAPSVRGTESGVLDNLPWVNQMFTDFSCPQEADMQRVMQRAFYTL